MTSSHPRPAPLGPAARPPSFWRRAALRWAALYWALYLPLMLLGLSYPPYQRALRAVVPWVGKHVLRLSYDIVVFDHRGGNTTHAYVTLLCQLALCAAAALAWAALDRRPPSDARLRDALRTYLRYALAYAMLLYGMDKALALQFPAPDLYDLTRMYGETSPMQLLWLFMGHSKGYQFFTGAAELLGGALLLFQPTTTLGALTVAAVMANVVALNFCYDVPVKLFASHLLAAACVLLAPDLRRLLDFFVLGRPVAPPRLRPPPRALWARRSAATLKAVVLVAMLFKCASITQWASRRRAAVAAVEHALPPGLYEVEAFARGGAEVPPRQGDRWHTAVVIASQHPGQPDGLSFRLMNDASRTFYVAAGPARDAVSLVPLDEGAPGAAEPAGVLRYERPDDEHLTLEGTLEGDGVAMRLRRRPEPNWVLTSREVRLVDDRPFRQ